MNCKTREPFNNIKWEEWEGGPEYGEKRLESDYNIAELLTALILLLICRITITYLQMARINIIRISTDTALVW